MGVAVLPPQDCLTRHHHHRNLISPAHKPSRRNPNANSNPNPNPNRSSRRRRNSPPPPPSSMPTKSQPRAKSPPLIVQMRILKRGEDLPTPTSLKEEQEVLTGPQPQSQPQPQEQPQSARVPDGFYAGSAFVTSPPPSSLPLPAFFTKRSCGLSEAHNQEIASELRRVLKLN